MTHTALADAVASTTIRTTTHDTVDNHVDSRLAGTRRRPFVAQLALIVAAFGAYMAVRAIANDSAATAHANAAQVLDFEDTIGIDWEQRIQRAALDHPDLISFFNFIYAWTYWPILIGTFIYTWTRRRDLYRIYRNAIFLSGGAGLAIFVLFPVAPPRFLDGFVDTVDTADRAHLIAQPSFIINQYAALPSFHVGWVTLALVVLGLARPHRVTRLVLLAPALLMAAAVIVTGNHYIIDAAAGITLSLLALRIARRRRPISPNTTLLDAATAGHPNSMIEKFPRVILGNVPLHLADAGITLSARRPDLAVRGARRRRHCDGRRKVHRSVRVQSARRPSRSRSPPWRRAMGTISRRPNEGGVS